MTILSHQSIRGLCAGPNPMITNANSDAQFRSASYDLRLGDEHYVSCVSSEASKPKIQRFSRDDQLLEIPPNQVALIRTHEDLAMPTDVVGHISLKLELLLRGVIAAPQSQIDAGYSGPIYGLLYNLSDQPVYIKRLTSVFRLEFAKLDAATAQPYSGGYKPSFSLADVVTKRIGSSLSTMHEEVNGFRKELARTKWVGALAVVTLILALIGIGVPFAQDAAKAKESVDRIYPADQSNTDKISSMQLQIANLEHQLADLQRKLSELK